MPRKTSSRRQYRSGVPVAGYIRPQLCKLVSEPPRGERWVHEIKLDGYRMQMHIRGGKTIFYSRNGVDWTHRFPEIAKACEALDDCVIDGEVCAIDKDGLPTANAFSLLTDALSAKKTAGLVFFVFDMMKGNSEDLTSYPLSTRKAVLKTAIKKLKRGDGQRLRFVDHQKSGGAAMLDAACRMGLEGIVSKVIDAPYRPDERGTWTKAKCRPAQELVVGGWTTTGAKFSSLLAGAYRGGRFVYVGHVGTGFNARNLPHLQDLLAALASKTRPFENTGEPKPSRDHHWVKPTLVIETEIGSWTSSGKIRQASFKGVREDKAAKDVVVEETA